MRASSETSTPIRVETSSIPYEAGDCRSLGRRRRNQFQLHPERTCDEGRIERHGFDRHGMTSHVQRHSLRRAESRSRDALSPPHDSTITTSPRRTRQTRYPGRDRYAAPKPPRRRPSRHRTARPTAARGAPRSAAAHADRATGRTTVERRRSDEAPGYVNYKLRFLDRQGCRPQRKSRPEAAC